MPAQKLQAVGKPDLVVENLRQEAGHIMADIRNVGTAASAATEVALLVSGRSVARQSLPALPAGQSRPLNFDIPVGAQSVQVMADIDDKVAESDETNNRPMALTLSTAGRQAATAPMTRLATEAVAKARPSADTIAPAAIGKTAAPKIAPLDTRIVPPAALSKLSVPGSVILRAGSADQILAKLDVSKTYSLAQLRSQPPLQLGDARVDFRSLLDNPMAPPTIAKRLREAPKLAEVGPDVTNAYVVPEGIVVHTAFSYRLKPGACSTDQQRAQLRSLGVRCFTRLSDTERAAQFFDPGNPRYVASPLQRAKAIKDAQAAARSEQMQVDKDIAELRKMLGDPARQTEVDAAFGGGQAGRLAAMTDAQLADEMVNMGEHKVEHLMSLPTVGEAEMAALAAQVYMTGGAGKGGNQDKLAIAPGWASGLPPQQPQPISKPLKTSTFLTGFTEGRDYEWRQRVETTIKWCLVGCKRTYYVELYAGFNYAFGLRFPIRISGHYDYEGKDKASVTTSFEAINGGPDDYRATGLPEQDVHLGKELVAEFGVRAGAAANLPTFPPIPPVEFSLDKDFTEKLPGAYAGGNFLPPSPGKPVPSANFIIDDWDLIGGRANFGVAGGQLFPAVRVDLQSKALKFKLFDNVLGKQYDLGTSGQKIPLGVNGTDQSSDFSIGAPLYNVGFKLTPGIDARLFIDIGVWSDHWDWPVWFPQLAFEVPRNGADFTCHANTQCTRNYYYSPTVAKEGEGANSAFEAELSAWAIGFEKRRMQGCADEICETGIKLVQLNAVLSGKKKFAANPKMQMQVMDPKNCSTWVTVSPDHMKRETCMAELQATKLTQESQARLTTGASMEWMVLAQAVWSKQCSDLACIDNVATIAVQMAGAAINLQKKQPDWSSLHVQGDVGKLYGPKFAQEIKASKARAALTAIMKTVQ